MASRAAALPRFARPTASSKNRVRETFGLAQDPCPCSGHELSAAEPKETKKTTTKKKKKKKKQKKKECYARPTFSSKIRKRETLDSQAPTCKHGTSAVQVCDKNFVKRQSGLFSTPLSAARSRLLPAAGPAPAKSATAEKKKQTIQNKVRRKLIGKSQHRPKVAPARSDSPVSIPSVPLLLTSNKPRSKRRPPLSMSWLPVTAYKTRGSAGDPPLGNPVSTTLLAPNAADVPAVLRATRLFSSNFEPASRASAAGRRAAPRSVATHGDRPGREAADAAQQSKLGAVARELHREIIAGPPLMPVLTPRSTSRIPRDADQHEDEGSTRSYSPLLNVHSPAVSRRWDAYSANSQSSASREEPDEDSNPLSPSSLILMPELAGTFTTLHGTDKAAAFAGQKDGAHESPDYERAAHAFPGHEGASQQSPGFGSASHQSPGHKGAFLKPAGSQARDSRKSAGYERASHEIVGYVRAFRETAGLQRASCESASYGGDCRGPLGDNSASYKSTSYESGFRGSAGAKRGHLTSSSYQRSVATSPASQRGPRKSASLEDASFELAEFERRSRTRGSPKTASPRELLAYEDHGSIKTSSYEGASRGPAPAGASREPVAHKRGSRTPAVPGRGSFKSPRHERAPKSISFEQAIRAISGGMPSNYKDHGSTGGEATSYERSIRAVSDRVLSDYKDHGHAGDEVASFEHALRVVSDHVVSNHESQASRKTSSSEGAYRVAVGDEGASTRPTRDDRASHESPSPERGSRKFSVHESGSSKSTSYKLGSHKSASLECGPLELSDLVDRRSNSSSSYQGASRGSTDDEETQSLAATIERPASPPASHCRGFRASSSHQRGSHKSPGYDGGSYKSSSFAHGSCELLDDKTCGSNECSSFEGASRDDRGASRESPSHWRGFHASSSSHQRGSHKSSGYDGGSYRSSSFAHGSCELLDDKTCGSTKSSRSEGASRGSAGNEGASKTTSHDRASHGSAGYQRSSHKSPGHDGGLFKSSTFAHGSHELSDYDHSSGKSAGYNAGTRESESYKRGADEFAVYRGFRESPSFERVSQKLTSAESASRGLASDERGSRGPPGRRFEASTTASIGTATQASVTDFAQDADASAGPQERLETASHQQNLAAIRTVSLATTVTAMGSPDTRADAILPVEVQEPVPKSSNADQEPSSPKSKASDDSDVSETSEAHLQRILADGIAHIAKIDAEDNGARASRFRPRPGESEEEYLQRKIVELEAHIAKIDAEDNGARAALCGPRKSRKSRQAAQEAAAAAAAVGDPRSHAKVAAPSQRVYESCGYPSCPRNGSHARCNLWPPLEVLVANLEESKARAARAEAIWEPKAKQIAELMVEVEAATADRPEPENVFKNMTCDEIYATLQEDFRKYDEYQARLKVWHAEWDRKQAERREYWADYWDRMAEKNKDGPWPI